MASIFDVANWFTDKEKMTHKKLQKLCYYAVAWSYAICPEPICEAVFEAWVHGPVSPELYNEYKKYGFNWINKTNIKPEFSAENQELLESVWETYGDMTANSLEVLTHSEMPWIKARIGLKPNENSNNKISREDMTSYYRSIYAGGDA